MIVNALRRQAPRSLKRAYTSAARPFIPPAQLHDLNWSVNRNASQKPAQQSEDSDPYDLFDERRQERERETAREAADRAAEEDDSEYNQDGPKTFKRPASPSFYTARASYYDNVIHLRTANSRIRGTLKSLQLLPLPEFAKKSLLDIPRPQWKTPEELTGDLETVVTNTRHRAILKELHEMHELYRIAKTAEAGDLTNMIDTILNMFKTGLQNPGNTRSRRKKVVLDRFGRSYTVGKRKTSAARVWMIPVNGTPKRELPAILKAANPEPSIDDAFGVETAPSLDSKITFSTVLVNNIPLAEYFPLPADRERVVRPFKVAGVLGKYNAFIIVRGGGTTGQSGAAMHGISKGLHAHEPELEKVLKACTSAMAFSLLHYLFKPTTAKLLRRDPRMVERKKPGMAKARKRVSCCISMLLAGPGTNGSTSSVYLGQTLSFIAGLMYILIMSNLISFPPLPKRVRVAVLNL